MIEYNITNITTLVSCNNFINRFGLNHCSTRGRLYTCYFCKFPCLKINSMGQTHPPTCYTCNKCNEIICNSCIELVQSQMKIDLKSNKQIKGHFHTNQEKYDEYIQNLEKKNNTLKKINNEFSNIIKTDYKLNFNKRELAKLIAAKEFAIGKHCPQMYEVYNIKECTWCQLYKPFIKDISNTSRNHSNIIILTGSLCYKCCDDSFTEEVFICTECAIILNKFKAVNCPKQSKYDLYDTSFSICYKCFSLKNLYDVNVKKDIEKAKNEYIKSITSQITNILEITEI